MTLDPSRNPYAAFAGSGMRPANNWYTLQNSDIGAKELPIYARALELSISPDVVLPLTMVVVPIGEVNDATTRTLTFTTAGEITVNRGVRRIVSIAGGSTVPSGLKVDLITD